MILRRLFGVLTALGLSGAVGAALRWRRQEGLPPQTGGWRELSADELARLGVDSTVSGDES